MMRIKLFVIVFLWCVSCGYRPVTGTVPGGGKTIYVPLVGNKTPYPSLAGPLTSVLRHRLAVSGVEVVNKSAGTARLQVKILGVQGDPGMLGTQGDQLVPVDTVWRIEAEARVIGSDGEDLKGPTLFDVQGRAFAQGGSALGEESLGQRERTDLLDDLADAIVSKLFEN